MTASGAQRVLDADYRYRRHTQKYAELNQGAGKLLIALLLFAWLMPQEVLVDLSMLEQDRQRIAHELPQVEAELASAGQRAAAIEQIQRVTDRVQAAIAGWRSGDHAQELIGSLRQVNTVVGTYRRAPLDELERRTSRRMSTSQADPSAGARPLDLESIDPEQEAALLAAARAAGEPPRDLDAEHRRLAVAVVQRFVARTCDWLLESFVTPVDALAPELEALAVAMPEAASLRQAIPQLSATLEEWRARLVDDPSWWRTVDEKQETILKLQQALHTAEQRIGDLARPLQQAGQVRKATADARVAELKRQQSGHAADAVKLEQRMKMLTPDWVQSVVTVPRMAGLFPYVLLFVAALLGFRLVRIRHHFLAMRSRLDPDDEYATDPALSSLLTLTWRRGATTGTAGAVLASIAVCWWGLETGIAALRHVEPDRLSPGWAHGWLGFAAWTGRLLAVLACVAAIVALRRPRVAS